MFGQQKFALRVVCLLAIIYKAQGLERQDHQHLQCWHCSSDTIGAEDFCGDSFDEDDIPTDLMKERNISVVRSCNSTINSEHERAVCRKTVEETNSKTITKRFCYYTNKSDSLERCAEEATDKNVRRVFCQDCLTDKCNGAHQWSLAWASLGMLLAPLAWTKVFKY